MDAKHEGVMRCLIACEFSGIVRQAFRDIGHDAWSCDLLPAEDGSPFHIQGDVFSVLDRGWDLMLQHWTCTLLCNSGVRWLFEDVDAGFANFLGRMARCTKKARNEVRFKAMEESARQFRRLMDCNIPRICGENPIPHKYARAIMGDYTQTIQPWQHGHGETKRTCLWLKNLPPLVPSKIVSGRTPRVHHASPGPDRWKERSRTLPGIAKAFAEQWGNLSAAD